MSEIYVPDQSTLPPLKIPDFRRLLLTRMGVTFALQSQGVIVGWQVYEITKDPFMLGLIGLTEGLPAIISSLFAGHIVDTKNPKLIYRLSILVLFLNSSLLCLLGGGFVNPPSGTILPWLFLGIFFSGLFKAYIGPCSFSLLPKIIERKNIQSASAWLSSGFQSSFIIGPALAGLLYGFGGASLAWKVPVISLAFAFIFSLYLKVSANHPRLTTPVPAFQNIRAGWEFLLKSPVLLSVMALDMFAVLFGGVTAILPAFASDILHIGPEGLGLLRASPALGAICLSVFFALFPMKSLSGKKLMFAVCGFGLSMIGFGLSESFVTAVFFLALSGGFDAVSVIMRGTITQFLTPEDMRGRVSSLSTMFIISSNELGAFQSGVAASLLGLAPSIIAGGFAALTIVGLTGYFSPPLRKLNIDTTKT